MKYSQITKKNGIECLSFVILIFDGTKGFSSWNLKDDIFFLTTTMDFFSWFDYENCFFFCWQNTLFFVAKMRKLSSLCFVWINAVNLITARTLRILQVNIDFIKCLASRFVLAFFHKSLLMNHSIEYYGILLFSFQKQLWNNSQFKTESLVYLYLFFKTNALALNCFFAAFPSNFGFISNLNSEILSNKRYENFCKCFRS